jgi:hypothetical protein
MEFPRDVCTPKIRSKTFSWSSQNRNPFTLVIPFCQTDVVKFYTTSYYTPLAHLGGTFGY